MSADTKRECNEIDYKILVCDLKVHIDSVGTFSLWILLRKIVIYLVGRKFQSSSTFSLSNLAKLPEVTSK